MTSEFAGRLAQGSRDRLSVVVAEKGRPRTTRSLPRSYVEPGGAARGEDDASDGIAGASSTQSVHRVRGQDQPGHRRVVAVGFDHGLRDRGQRGGAARGDGGARATAA